METREYRDRLKRRKRQEEKRRQLRRKQTLMGLCVLAVLAGTVILMTRAVGYAAGKNSQKAEDGTIVSGEQEKLTSSVRETAEVRQQWAEVPRMEAVYSICPFGSGWSYDYKDNICAMTPIGSYLTAVRVSLKDKPDGMTGILEYSVNLSGSGWMDWTGESGEAGQASGEAALEAIRIRLTGELSDYYDVLYCVLQNNRWTEWVKNGEESGESGVGLHMDGLRVSVVRRVPGKESYAGEIDPARPMIALTYDDGPSRMTPRILEKLRECGGHATFFMVGQRVGDYADVVRQMAAQGCETANHTFGHVSMNKLTQQGLAEQLMLTNKSVADLCGTTPALMRPVGGNENSSGLEAVGVMGMPAIVWSVDTLDWKTRDAASTVQAVRDKVQDGDIVLMHDLYEATADASMIIIDELISQGYQLVTVSELSAYRGGLLPGKSYGKFRP